jgi:hypothetical protein
MTPLPIVLGYFIVATVIAVLIIWKAKPKFSTIDLVYIGIEGAFVAVADHIFGDMIFCQMVFTHLLTLRYGSGLLRRLL